MSSVARNDGPESRTRIGSVKCVTSTMLGSGLYDASEVALLAGLTPQQVVRWSTPTTHGDPPVKASFDRLFAFADLIAFTVARQIRANGVSDLHLRRGVTKLRSVWGVEDPLASAEVIERLATSGDSFLAQLVDDDYEDIGRGGQGTFQDVIKLHLRRIEFDAGGRPTRWRPIDGISIDPTVQAGAPCIEGTRVPTSVVAGRAADERNEEIAFDLGLEPEAVDIAVEFEALLAEGAGIPV